MYHPPQSLKDSSAAASNPAQQTSLGDQANQRNDGRRPDETCRRPYIYLLEALLEEILEARLEDLLEALLEKAFANQEALYAE